MKSALLYFSAIVFGNQCFSQNIGVGTSAPSAPLHVRSLSVAELLRLEANTPYVSFYDNSKGYVGYLWYNTKQMELGTPFGSAEPVVIAPGRNEFASFLPSGRVGLGTSTPNERLDVSGNINLSGTIKVNGTDGQPDQVLMKNSSGNLIWGDMSEYKNFTSFIDAGVHTWAVPAGFTKIMFEAWGAGGGGNAIGGGGGGGYICGRMNVIPGQVVNIDVGNGGGGASATAAGDGGYSRVTISAFVWTAYGGTGASTVIPGPGGVYSHNSVLSFKGMEGEPGGTSTETYEQSSSTIFVRAIRYGGGGDGGNTVNTGAKGGFRSFNAATAVILTSFTPTYSSAPGGGGAGHANGIYGAKGLVIIYW